MSLNSFYWEFELQMYDFHASCYYQICVLIIMKLDRILEHAKTHCDIAKKTQIWLEQKQVKILVHLFQKNHECALC